MRKLREGGQNLTELALCLAVVATAIVTLQIYVQRGLQARYKDGADYVSAQVTKETLRQYDPYYQQSKMVLTEDSNSTTGFPTTSINTKSTRSGWQKVGSAADDD